MPAILTEPVKANTVLLDQILDFSKDIVISGEFSCFGGEVYGGEGFSIYVVAAKTIGVNNNVGSPGPGLGYAPTTNIVKYATGTDIFTGIENAVLGVGFDIVGDFALPLGGAVDGDSVAHPNAITLRHGSALDYSYIDSSSPLSAYDINLYQVYSASYPVSTSTPTPTATSTPTKTFTNTIGATATSTPTQTRSISPTGTTTPTVTATPTPTATGTLTPTVSITTTKTKSITPTQTPTQTRTQTRTPTSTGLFPIKKAFKVRLSNYGTKIQVFLKSVATEDSFVKVFEKSGIDFVAPLNNQCQVGLSVVTGVKYSNFYLYNFAVNGTYFTNAYTPTPTATYQVTATRTQTPTLTPTSTQTPTRPSLTPTASSYPTPTPTQTPTQTLTQTNTRTSVITRTPTPTQTQTPTQSPTASVSPYATPTSTPPRVYVTPTPSKTDPFMAAADSSYKFVFESNWKQADTAAAAVNVLINNIRFALTRNIGSDNLLNIRSSNNNSGVINDFDTKYIKSYFYNGTAYNAQIQSRVNSTGVSSWLSIPFVELIAPSNNPIADYRIGISSNVYQALRTLSNTGNTLAQTLLYINKTDNTSGVTPPSDYNIWNILGISNDYKTPIFDINTNDEYVLNYSNTGKIIYNLNYVYATGISKDMFPYIPDAYRLLPGLRYLRIIDGEIDVTFSYCTELINYIGDPASLNNTYWGARLTLFTNAKQ